MKTNNKVIAIFAHDNITLKVCRSNEYYSFILSDDQESIYYDMNVDESNIINSMNVPIERYVGFMKHKRYDSQNNVNYSEKIEFKPVINLLDKDDRNLDIKIRWKYGNHTTTYSIRLNNNQFKQYQQCITGDALMHD